MRKNNFKRMISLVLAVVTVFVLCPAVQAAAGTAAPATCPCCGGSLSALSYDTWDGTVEYMGDDAHYKLTASTKTDCITVAAGQNLVLDLNGYRLYAAEAQRVFRVEGTLTVLDSSAKGTGQLVGSDVSVNGKTDAGYGGTVFVSGGTFNLLSGTVTGGSAIYGGNIFCENEAVLNMYGGTVSNGTAVAVEMAEKNNTGRGGNLYLSSTTATICGDARILDGTAKYLAVNSGRGGNLYIIGAKETVISGNAVLAGGYAEQRGGNVAVNSGAILTVRENASLYGGVAKRYSNNVDVMTATLNVEGGTIYGSPVGSCSTNILVYSPSSVFNFTGGKIYGKISAVAGMTINISGKPYIEHLFLPQTLNDDGTVASSALVTPGTFEEGAWIGVEAEKWQHITGPLEDPSCYIYFFNYQKTGLSWYDRSGGTNAIYLTTGTPCQCCGEDVNDITWTTIGVSAGWMGIDTLTAGHYKLTGNVNLQNMANPASVSVDGTAGAVTLNLNGYTLTGPTDMRVFDFVGGTFNIVDNSSSGSGKIQTSGTFAGTGGVIALLKTGSELNLYGGTLTGNTTGYTNYGGAVYVTVQNTLNIYGGLIKDSTSQGHGGNIYVTDSSTINLYDGTVSGGKVTGGTKTDGTSFTGAGGNIYITGLSVMNMYGGTVENGLNYVSTGGNIQVNSGAAMYMYDGVVQNGSALKNAGNIYISSARNGHNSSFEMYGGTIGAADNTVASVNSLGRQSSDNPLVIYNGTVLNQDVTAYLADCACYSVDGTDSTVWNYGHNENTCGSDCPMEQVWGKAYVKTLRTGSHNYQTEVGKNTCYCTLCGYVYQGDAAVVANGTPYASITDALSSITSGTVALLQDITQTEVVISGITLDLNGHTLTADTFSSAASGNVIDTSARTKGKLVCDSVTLAAENECLPITLADGIYFCPVGFTQWLERVDENTTKVKFYFTQRSYETLIDETVNLGSDEVAVQINLTWTDSTGVAQDKTYVFSRELLQKYAEKWNSRVFVTTIGGVGNISDLKCTYQVTSTATSGTTVSSVTLNNVAVIQEKLSWDAINSYPIKKSTMTVEEMRQLCLDFMEFNKTYLWTPDTTVSYIRNASGSADVMNQGTIYGGLPYVGVASGNCYRMMDYINPDTGLLDMRKALPTLGTKEQLSMAELKYFGSQCSICVYWGWGRVMNSAAYMWTSSVVPNNDFVILGDIQIPNIASWTTTYGTDECLAENGEQAAFSGYAQLQKADGMVYYTTAGHLVMVYSDPVVVYNSDGTINGNQSYLTIIDQAQKWQEGTNASGDTYQFKEGVATKKTFKQLFNSNYIPFTFKEFLGTDPIEETDVSLVGSDKTVYASGYVDENTQEYLQMEQVDSLTWTELFSSKVTSNYGIVDAYVIVYDEAGEEIYRHAVRTATAGNKNLSLAESGAMVTVWKTANLYPGRTYDMKLEVQLATGERPVIYTGQLTIQ